MQDEAPDEDLVVPAREVRAALGLADGLLVAPCKRRRARRQTCVRPTAARLRRTPTRGGGG
jgi:hypothetical protein